MSEKECEHEIDLSKYPRNWLENALLTLRKDLTAATRERDEARDALDAVVNEGHEPDCAGHNGGQECGCGWLQQQGAHKYIVTLQQQRTAAVEALEKAKRALGAHGPCRNNSCRDCKQAWQAIERALTLCRAGKDGSTSRTITVSCTDPDNCGQCKGYHNNGHAGRPI